MSQGNSFYTLSDYFYLKYGKAVGFLSSIIVLTYMLLMLMVQLIGGAKAVAHLSGGSFSTSFILISVTIFIYIVFGGFKAVIKTDIIQFFAIFSIIALLALS